MRCSLPHEILASRAGLPLTRAPILAKRARDPGHDARDHWRGVQTVISMSAAGLRSRPQRRYSTTTNTNSPDYVACVNEGNDPSFSPHESRQQALSDIRAASAFPAHQIFRKSCSTRSCGRRSHISSRLYRHVKLKNGKSGWCETVFKILMLRALALPYSAAATWNTDPIVILPDVVLEDSGMTTVPDCFIYQNDDSTVTLTHRGVEQRLPSSSTS